MKKPSEVFDTPQATGFDRVTHNSRDWEADFDTLFEWTDFDGQIGSFVLVKTKSDYAIEETERNELKAFIHQELQKAREERKKARNLYQGLQMMFDQYCPKGDHQFMTAGETAEELLNMYTDLQCDCEEAPEQQEWDGHTRYCKALDQSELDQPTV